MNPRTATTTSTRTTELDPFVDAAEEASRDVKKAYLYTNNHFSAKSVANAATIKNEARAAAARRVPGGVRRTLSGPERDRQDFAASSFR